MLVGMGECTGVANHLDMIGLSAAVIVTYRPVI